MRHRLPAMAEALKSPIPWVAFSAMLALTTGAWFGLERNTAQQAQSQFERRTESAIVAVRTRFLSYEQVLRSGAARMASSPTVSRDEWRQFISHLQIEERFPGIHSMGYAERTPAENGEGAMALFNEPSIARNARVIGTDLGADPVQKKALELARDTLDVAITERVMLPGEPSRGPQARQPGFIMFMPVLPELPRSVPRTERRNAVSGYVFTPLRMNDMLRGVMDEGVLQRLDLRIFDEPGPEGPREMIDTRTAWRAAPEASDEPLFQRTVSMPMPGRNWTVQFLSRPEFDESLRAGRPWVVLWVGLFGTLVVFVLTTALLTTWNRAHQLSMRDPLTGLYNRRYLDETISRELPRARRQGHTIGLILVDIDHFKRLNDTHGHDAGDYVLSQMGELMRAMTRGSDIACRLGGEEFAVVLPGAAIDVASKRAEQLRHALEALNLDFEGKWLGRITLSAGVAALQPHQQNWAQVMRNADAALYAAKQAGRNRVMHSEDL
jgi:diguanylate cyclase (GGDEF)-like protein